MDHNTSKVDKEYLQSKKYRIKNVIFNTNLFQFTIIFSLNCDSVIHLSWAKQLGGCVMRATGVCLGCIIVAASEGHLSSSQLKVA